MPISTVHALGDRDAAEATSPASLHFWKRTLGLLPVPLYAEADQTPARHILLNGARGNFCLDLAGHAPDEVSRNQAWSSNVGHFVAVVGNEVKVQRWDPMVGPSVQRFRMADVAQRPELFHRRLEEVIPRPEQSVVAHALLRFRELRAVLGREATGTEALRAFLYLLATSVEGRGATTLDVETWRLDADAARVATAIDAATWETLTSALLRGRPQEQLTTDLTLLLRHASGTLFQEAHYVASLDSSSELLLPGFLPKAARLTRESSGGIGLHFTPPALARTLVEEALAAMGGAVPPVVTVFDPACGSGEFLREAVRQLVVAGHTGTVRVKGFDLSPAACDMANFALAWEARSAPASLRVEIDIQHRDALAEETVWPDQVDLVLMNPPFVEYRQLTGAQHASITRILGERRGQRPDMATAFLVKAARTLRNRGVLGAITPASFLDGTSALLARQELGEQLHARLIARLGSHQLFAHAQVDAALLVLQQGQSEDAPVAFWADHRPSSSAAGLRTLRRLRFSRGTPSDVAPAQTAAMDDTVATGGDPGGDGYSIYPNPKLTVDPKSWSPRPYRAWRRLLALREAGLPAVNALFSVRQGVITGHNKAFLLRAEEWSQLPASEQRYFRPAVLNESIAGGRLSTTAYVFYPYGKDREGAELSLETEAALTAALPTYHASHLQRFREALEKRAGIGATGWWQLTRNRLQMTQSRSPKLLSTYFGTTGSFAWDASGDRVVVQGYAWVPKHRAGHTVAQAYVPILNSAIFADLLAARSNNVGGGQWNLSVRFVEDLPLPHLSLTTNRSLVRQLLDLSERIEVHALGGLPESDRLAINELAEVAYGVAGGG
jgi:hypothetical protein